MYSAGEPLNSFGATILDPLGLRLEAQEKAFLRDADPFGFILFARNIDSPEQLRALCGDLREAVGREALITIDQEGGRVQRLRPPHWRAWLPPLDHVTAVGDRAERAMYLRYRLIADELRNLGIDSNCAPMADLVHPATHPFLRNRCYGETAQTVARLARAVAQGLLDGGVLPVLKHMPGHGRAMADSHHELPRVDAPAQELHDSDFAAFRAVRDLPMAMTAHLVYGQIDETPATISPRMMQLIREEIGYDGLIMTDDISMKALSGSLSDLSRAAIHAGCDVVLHCNGTLAEKQQVVEATGRLNEAGQARALAALAARRPPEPVDIAALEAELRGLTDG